MTDSKFWDVRRYPQGHRLYHPFTDVSVFITAMQFAWAYRKGLTLPEPSAGRLNCAQFDHAFAVPLGGAFDNALGEVAAPFTEIGCIASAPKSGPVVEGGVDESTTGLSQVCWHIIAAIYLKYFEPYSEWLDDNLGEAVNWPSTLNFCRVVRNSIAHGKIHIRNPSAPPVTWRGLTYGPKQNGQSVLGHGLSAGDVIGLMIESSDLLDDLNAPTYAA